MKKQVQRKKEYNYTGIRPEQFWGKTTIHGVLIYQYGSPNNPQQVHCNAAQNAAPTHDACQATDLSTQPKDDDDDDTSLEPQGL